MTHTKYLFIDGSYLTKLLDVYSKEYFDGELRFLELQSLKSEFDKIFYYDCIPSISDGISEEEEGRINDYINKMRMFSGFHVYEGAIKGEGKKRRQKQIDILISVHMLTHSFNKNMIEAVLLTGDLDFKPLIDALVDNGTYISLLCDIKRASKELMYAADTVYDLNFNWFYRYSPKSIRNNFNPLEAVNTGPFNPTGYELVNTGKLQTGENVNWYKNNNHNVIVHETDVENRFIHLKHARKDHLLKFIKDRGLVISWNNPIS